MRHRLWVIDLVVVLVFVLIGRDTHDRGSALADGARTLTPFVIGLAVAWLVVRVWQRPPSWPVGVPVALVTVAVGMVARPVLFDDGTATSFVVVALAFNLAAMVGWRLVAGWLGSRRSPALSSP